MNGSSASSSLAAGAALWAASGGAAADGAFAGASAASSKCADTDRFGAPEVLKADGVVARAADDDGAWAATAGAWDAFAAVAWAVLSAFRRICAELSFLKSTAGAADS
jgi:hypothetical protein